MAKQSKGFVARGQMKVETARHRPVPPEPPQHALLPPVSPGFRLQALATLTPSDRSDSTARSRSIPRA